MSRVSGTTSPRARSGSLRATKKKRCRPERKLSIDMSHGYSLAAAERLLPVGNSLGLPPGSRVIRWWRSSVRRIWMPCLSYTRIRLILSSGGHTPNDGPSSEICPRYGQPRSGGSRAGGAQRTMDLSEVRPAAERREPRREMDLSEVRPAAKRRDRRPGHAPRVPAGETERRQALTVGRDPEMAAGFSADGRACPRARATDGPTRGPGCCRAARARLARV